MMPQYWCWGPMMSQQQPGMMSGPGPAAASMYLPPGMQQRTPGVAAHSLMGLQAQQPMPYSIPTPGLPPVRMTGNPAAQAAQLPNAHQMMNPGLAGVHQPGMTPAQQQQQQQQMNAIAAQNAIAQQQQNNAAVAAMNNAAKNGSMIGMQMNSGMAGGFGQPGSQMQQFHMPQQPQQQGQQDAVQPGRVGQQMSTVPQNAAPGNMIPLNALNAPNNMAANRAQAPMQMNQPTSQMPNNMGAQNAATPNQPVPGANNPTAQPGLQVPTNPAEIRERLLQTFKHLVERGDAAFPEASRMLTHHIEAARRHVQAHPGNPTLATKQKRLEQAQKILQHFSKVSADFKAGNANINQKVAYQLSHIVKNVENLAKQFANNAAPATPATQQSEGPKPMGGSSFMPTPGQAPTPGTHETTEKGEVIDLTEHRHDGAGGMHAAAAHPTPNSLPANANSPAVLPAPSPHAASPAPGTQPTAQRASMPPRAPESHQSAATQVNPNFALPPKGAGAPAAQQALSAQMSTPGGETTTQADTAAAAVSTPATESQAPTLDPMVVLQQQLDAISSGSTPSLDVLRAQQYIRAAGQQSQVVPIPPSVLSSQLKLDDFTSPRLHSCNIATFTVDNMRYDDEEPKSEATELSSADVLPVLPPQQSEQVLNSRKRARLVAEEECNSADSQLLEGTQLSLHAPDQVDVPCTPDTAVVVEVNVVEDNGSDTSEEEKSWKRLKLAVPTDYPDAPPYAILPSMHQVSFSAKYQAAVREFQAGLEEHPSLKIHDMANIWSSSVRSCSANTLVA